MSVRAAIGAKSGPQVGVCKPTRACRNRPSKRPSERALLVDAVQSLHFFEYSQRVVLADLQKSELRRPYGTAKIMLRSVARLHVSRDGIHGFALLMSGS
jgi:hypothetical protein